MRGFSTRIQLQTQLFLQWFVISNTAKWSRAAPQALAPDIPPCAGWLCGGGWNCRSHPHDVGQHSTNSISQCHAMLFAFSMLGFFKQCDRLSESNRPRQRFQGGCEVRHWPRPTRFRPLISHLNGTELAGPAIGWALLRWVLGRCSMSRGSDLIIVHCCSQW